MMPRGKPFICWLDYGGKPNEVPLCVGDEVEIRKEDSRWIRGKIGYRGEWLVVRYGKEIENVFMRTQLRPVKEP